MKKRVIIIGAGPTGLSAAYKLAENGFKIIILEKAGQVGGITATVERKGIPVDTGPHRFTPHTEEVKDFIFHLLKERVIIRKQICHIFFWGKFLKYPLEFKKIIFKVSPFLLFRVTISYFFYFLKNVLRKIEAKSYRDYIYLNFGPFLSEAIFCPIAEKTWKVSSSQLSAELAKQRIALENLLRTAINVLFQRKPKIYQTQQLTPSDFFYYFKGGFGQLSEALKKEIEKAGGKVELNSLATKIEIENNKVRSVVYTKDEKEHQIECDWLIATNPITQIIDSFLPLIESSDVHKAKELLKFRHLLLFYLILEKPKVSDNVSFFFPEKAFPFGRIFEQKNYDPKMLPKDKTVLGAEITCKEESFLWRVSDEQIAKEIVPLLERVKLIKNEEIIDYFSFRLKDIYPVYDLNYKENLDILIKETDKTENLIVNGRPGLFMYNNTHHCIEMGFLSADQIISGKKKAEKWNKDREIFKSYSIIE